MSNLVWTPKFIKSYKKVIKRNPNLKSKIIKVLELIVSNPFDNVLKTHKLNGKYQNLYSCKVEYDLRIVFEINTEVNEILIILFNIGTHDKVY